MGNTLKKIGKISPVRQEFRAENGDSLASSLTKAGKNKFPGCSEVLPPYREKDGSYRTGLDENAFYIKALESSGKTLEAEQEKEIVRGYLKHAQTITGIEDLGPRSDYYSKMFHEDFRNTGRATRLLFLKDEKNLFDLNDPEQALIYFWARVHPQIAPSYEAHTNNLQSIRCPKPGQVKWFVEDEEVETKIAYSRAIQLNKAINKLTDMNPVKRMKVAKLLGLPVSYSTAEETVYTELDAFIKDTNTGGEKSANIQLFDKIADMAEASMEIQFLVRNAIELSVYRTGTGGIIYRGKTEMAKSEEDLVIFLSNPSNQEELLAIKAELAQKTGVLAVS